MSPKCQARRQDPQSKHGYSSDCSALSPVTIKTRCFENRPHLLLPFSPHTQHPSPEKALLNTTRKHREWGRSCAKALCTCTLYPGRCKKTSSQKTHSNQTNKQKITRGNFSFLTFALIEKQTVLLDKENQGLISMSAVVSRALLVMAKACLWRFLDSVIVSCSILGIRITWREPSGKTLKSLESALTVPNNNRFYWMLLRTTFCSKNSLQIGSPSQESNFTKFKRCVTHFS